MNPNKAFRMATRQKTLLSDKPSFYYLGGRPAGGRAVPKIRNAIPAQFARCQREMLG
jgi:hypothetical protein